MTLSFRGVNQGEWTRMFRNMTTKTLNSAANPAVGTACLPRATLSKRK